VNAVIVLATLLGLGLRAYLLVRPGLEAVTQYDDGPYFGSAVRLVHGVLPYRGFAFVQPPGITLLMTPAAALSYLTGTAPALVVARVLTVLAGAASVPLGGLLVRHRGTLATGLACGILAIYPPAAAASHTVLLEPWLVLFCLAGALAVVDRDVLANPRRLAWGGVLFGAGGTVKVWAVVPVLVIFVLCLPRVRRAAVFAAGAAAGFLVPSAPFAAAAPRAFYNSVVVAQLARVGGRVPVWDRLRAMLGLTQAIRWPHAGLLWLLAGVLAVAVVLPVALWLVTRRPPARLDWFALVTAVLVGAMFLWPPYFSAHYVTFLAPFLALALALPVSRLVAAGRPLAGQARAGRWLGRGTACLLGAGLVAAAVFPTLTTGRRPSPPPSEISQVIPAGACVLTDQASYLLAADRFLSRVPGCSQMVDSLGTDLALSGGRRPSTGAAAFPAVRAAWRAAFRPAQYALLSVRNRLRVPWTPSLLAYLHRHFQPVLRTDVYTVYARTGHRAR
jgi:4-amino-4-deoxy-L-arabinose transferase-like glycosyltransferase